MLGYDPQKYYSGRSPLEALSIGVDMKDTDVALRCNFVTLEEDGEYEDKKITDHSAGEITTEEAEILVQAVKEALETEEFKFYAGVSYRHLTIWDHGKVVELTPPHDILGKQIGEFLPEEERLKEMMKKSFEILDHHPVNEERAKKGLNKANSIWFWGAGTRPALDQFEGKTGMKGAMVSAVDLLKGIAVGAQMRNLDVEGANGGLDTNYKGKAEAALQALLEKGDDFAYIHVEAPDEMGHQGNVEHKIQAIEYLDDQVVRIVKEGLEKAGEDFRMLIGPDHPTPIAIRTHTKDPIPFMIYDSRKSLGSMEEYSEEAAGSTGLVVEHGYELMNRLLQK